jgi:hypothetical protein
MEIRIIEIGCLTCSLVEVTHSKEEADRLGVNSNIARTTNATRLRIQVRSEFLNILKILDLLPYRQDRDDPFE